VAQEPEADEANVKSRPQKCSYIGDNTILYKYLVHQKWRNYLQKNGNILSSVIDIPLQIDHNDDGYTKTILRVIATGLNDQAQQCS
jgi:hypothetical protein